MRAFITVGSTQFDALVQAALSEAVLSALRLKGYTELAVQCGNSSFDLAPSIAQNQVQTVERNGVVVELWKFKPTLQEEYEKADLVVSHAGSGTILDVLRVGKPLIVVPNSTLLDNHQEELASALGDRGHLRASDVPNLASTIGSFDPLSLMPFPPFDGSRFAKLLDEEMGFM